jgi:hypothetical protein
MNIRASGHEEAELLSPLVEGQDRLDGRGFGGKLRGIGLVIGVEYFQAVQPHFLHHPQTIGEGHPMLPVVAGMGEDGVAPGSVNESNPLGQRRARNLCPQASVGQPLLEEPVPVLGIQMLKPGMLAEALEDVGLHPRVCLGGKDGLGRQEFLPEFPIDGLHQAHVLDPPDLVNVIQIGLQLRMVRLKVEAQEVDFIILPLAVQLDAGMEF